MKSHSKAVPLSVFVPRYETGIRLVDMMLGGGIPVGEMVGVRGGDRAAVRALPWQLIEHTLRRNHDCAVVRVDDAEPPFALAGQPPFAIYGERRAARRHSVAKLRDPLATLVSVHAPADDREAILAAASELVTESLAVVVIEGMRQPGIGDPGVPEKAVEELLQRLDANGVACLYTVHEPRRARRTARAVAVPGTWQLQRRTAVQVDLGRSFRPRRGERADAEHVRVRIDRRGKGGPPRMARLELSDHGRLGAGRLSSTTLVDLGVASGVVRTGPQGQLSFDGDRIGPDAATAAYRLGWDYSLADALQARLVRQDDFPF